MNKINISKITIKLAIISVLYKLKKEWLLILTIFKYLLALIIKDIDVDIININILYILQIKKNSGFCYINIRS